MIELSALRSSGVFLRREAIEAGYRDRDLARARRAGLIHRVRHGAYVDAALWTPADKPAQHRLACSAIALSHGDSIAFSHVSAVVLLGCEVWRTDLDRMHVTKLTDTTGRRNGDVVYHEGRICLADLVELDGIRVVAPPYAVLGAAAMVSVEAGMVLIDSAYRLGLVAPADLRVAYGEMQGWPGTARLQITLRLAEPGSESVGETRARYLFWRCHLPKPVLQYQVCDPYGRVIGISDFAWPSLGLLGEFDGRIKYGRLLRPGQEPGDAVYAEKLREDRMREVTGWRFLRLGWDDLEHPQRVSERFRTLVRRSR